jgi:hypothetical protein
MKIDRLWVFAMDNWQAVIVFLKNILLGIFLIYNSNAIPIVPHTLPPPLPYPPTPTFWPWCSPVLRHIKFAWPKGLSFHWWPTRPSFDTYADRDKSSGVHVSSCCCSTYRVADPFSSLGTFSSSSIGSPVIHSYVTILVSKYRLPWGVQVLRKQEEPICLKISILQNILEPPFPSNKAHWNCELRFLWASYDLCVFGVSAVLKWNEGFCGWFPYCPLSESYV